MRPFREYGEPPFNVVVVHGGPGAAGEMASIAEELSKTHGVIEPFQLEFTIEKQIQELKRIILENTSYPVTLIGYSWGAMLCFIFAADNPSLVKKLILISSAVFDEKYAKEILNQRLERMDNDEKRQFKAILVNLNDSCEVNKKLIFEKFEKLMVKIDSYDPILPKTDKIYFRYDIYRAIWPEAQKLRQSGDLIKLGSQIQCPVIAIHGEYDPHPAKGINKPLSAVLEDFKFILLKKCGHIPWIERQAKEKFYEKLKNELL